MALAHQGFMFVAADLAIQGVLCSATIREQVAETGQVPNVSGTVENLPATEPSGLHKTAQGYADNWNL